MKYTLLLLVIFLTCSATKNSDTSQGNCDKIMDNWHLAATNAKFDDFFNQMDSAFSYLGTAPGEHWSKEQFATYCKPYFEKGKAWDFKPSNRIWQKGTSKNMKIFTEDLQTWMRSCRGSGIMIKRQGKWRLLYYNLTVLIENEKIQEFIKLRDM